MSEVARLLSNLLARLLSNFNTWNRHPILNKEKWDIKKKILKCHKILAEYFQGICSGRYANTEYLGINILQDIIEDAGRNRDGNFIQAYGRNFNLTGQSISDVWWLFLDNNILKTDLHRKLQNKKSPTDWIILCMV